jgi:cell division protein FtsB
MMKLLSLIFVFLICLLQYRIWWGENGHHKIELLQAKIEQQTKQNAILQARNEMLSKEIKLLRTHPALLEEKAREQLGLVKPGEKFYRILPTDEK